MTQPTDTQKRDFIISKLVDIVEKQHTLITQMAATTSEVLSREPGHDKLITAMNRAVAASTLLVTDIKTIWKGPES